MAINENTQIKTLIKLGLIEESQIETWNKKVERAEARALSQKELTSCIDQISQVLNDEAHKEIQFFSVNQLLIQKDSLSSSKPIVV